jgi:hypothetical protein
LKYCLLAQRKVCADDFVKIDFIKSLSVLALCIVCLGCSEREAGPAEPDFDVIVVRVPPFFDPTLTPSQNQLRYTQFLFPRQGDAPPTFPTSAGLANDDSTIYVAFSPGSQVTVNGEPQRGLSAVTDTLAEVFESRRRNGVFEPESDKVVKAVGIRIPASAKYSDLLSVARAVENSGANPIVLLLEGHLPYQLVQLPEVAR